MVRFPSIAAAGAALLVAAAVPTLADEPVHVEGPADWLAGAPGPDHAARAYPQYAQQQPSSPIRFMSVVQLQQRLKSGAPFRPPFIVDVRSYEEFAAARLPNAVSIPLPDIEKRLAEFPREGTIVLY